MQNMQTNIHIVNMLLLFNSKPTKISMKAY